MEHVPLTGELGPLEHDPPEQLSPTVQEFPSLQLLPSEEQADHPPQLPVLPQVLVWLPAQVPDPQAWTSTLPGLAPPEQVTAGGGAVPGLHVSDPTQYIPVDPSGHQTLPEDIQDGLSPVQL